MEICPVLTYTNNNTDTSNNETFKRIIGWEKWIDPFDEVLDNIQTEGSIDDDDDDNGNLYESNPIPMNPTIAHTPVLMTPAGPLPLNPSVRPGKTYNLWIGHTNFKITHNIKNIIENVDGIEILDICTPYRMRIGIGKMFTDIKVRQRVNQAINYYFNLQEKTLHG